MSEKSFGFLIPNEPQVMQAIRSNMMTALRAVAGETSVPMPVALNATASVLAHVSMLAILEYAEEGPDRGAAFEREAFRRIMDACASMEDWKERKSPWRLQSSSLKRAEREGAEVMDVSDLNMSTTKQ